MSYMVTIRDRDEFDEIVGAILPHAVKCPIEMVQLGNDHQEAVHWCTERFGSPTLIFMTGSLEAPNFILEPTHRWDWWGCVFRFKDVKDALLFKLAGAVR